MKISIILPVYNVEQYIESCILSVVKQLDEEDELIIVDDGSDDASGTICEKYRLNYQNIQVYHVPNGGVSSARNIGLEKASGQYVWFIDSDDYIYPDALQKIKNYIVEKEPLDLLLFDADVVDGSGRLLSKITANHQGGEIEYKEIMPQMISQNTSLWNRIYQMEIIKEHSIFFEEGISIAEDLLFNFKYLLECKHVRYLKESLYYYVQRENSAMSGRGKDIHVQLAMEKLYAYYINKGVYEKYREELDYLAIYHYYLTTSVRIIRSHTNFNACKNIKAWFADKQIQISMKNRYVKQLPFKHKIILLLLNAKMYGVVKFLFEKK